MKSTRAEDIKLTEQEIISVVKNISSDFDVVTPKIRFKKEEGCSGSFASTTTNNILYIGDLNLATTLHELAHHIEYERTGKTSHRVNFHRTCFEMRDWIKNAYGVDYNDINSYTDTESHDKALYEWKVRRIERGEM